MELKKKRGPKPLKGESMSQTERNRRVKVRQQCLARAAEKSGFLSTQILINTNQLEALKKFSYIRTRNKSAFDLSSDIFFALKMFLESLAEDSKQWGIPNEIIDACAYGDVNAHMDNYDILLEIRLQAQKLFAEWEQNQTTEQ